MSLFYAVLCACALCFVGMFALSLAMDRHHGQVTGRATLPPVQRGSLRVTGVGGLAAALWLCTVVWGGSVGFVVWCGVLTVAATLVVWALAYQARHAAGFLAIAISGGAVAWSLY